MLESLVCPYHIPSTCHTWVSLLPPIIKRRRHVGFANAFLDDTIFWSHHPTIVSFTQLIHRKTKLQTQNSLHQWWQVKFESANCCVIVIPLTLTTVQLYILYNCVKKVVLNSCFKQRVLNSNYTNASIALTYYETVRSVKYLYKYHMIYIIL